MSEEEIKQSIDDAVAVSADEKEDEDQRSQREKLREVGSAAALWTDGDTSYATVELDGHTENFPVRSGQFRKWMYVRYFEKYGLVPSRQQVDETAVFFDAYAAYRGEKYQPEHRVAGDKYCISIDLADEQWRAVEIQPYGWNVINEPSVKFIRRQHMKALPVPDRHGDISVLRDFTNLSDDHFRLAVAWLIGALRPNGPYPILAISGEQGGGKSTLCRVLRKLVDPSAVEINTPPNSQRDLVAMARHSWVVCLDNISNVSPWLSDALCRISTGGGLGGRKLYTDDDQATFEAQRPVLINGIPTLAERPDLADRVLALTVQEIPPDKRQDEQTFWDRFEQARPVILGGILNVISAALARYPNTHLKDAPRMADFARWMAAAEEALGWGDGAFLQVYADNRSDAVIAAVEADEVACAVQAFASENEWTGTATDLLQELVKNQPEEAIKSKGWPKKPNTLSNRLRRVAPDLRRVGIEVRELGKTTPDRRVRWQIIKGDKTIVPIVPIVPTTGNEAFRGNDPSNKTVPGNDAERKIVPEKPQKTANRNDGNDANDGSDIRRCIWCRCPVEGERGIHWTIQDGKFVHMGSCPYRGTGPNIPAGKKGWSTTI